MTTAIPYTTPYRSGAALHDTLIAAASRTIITLAGERFAPLTATYTGRKVVFTNDDTAPFLADAIVAVTRGEGEPAQPGEAPRVAQLSGLQGRCRGWMLEAEVGTKPNKTLKLKARSVRDFQQCRPAEARAVLIVTPDAAESQRVQTAWQEAWPGGVWLFAAVEELLAGRVRVYRDGVIFPRELFAESDVAGEEWQQ